MVLRIAFLSPLIVSLCFVSVWSQDVPPPPPMPPGASALPGSPSDNPQGPVGPMVPLQPPQPPYPPPGAYAPPAGPYYPSPGAVIIAPGQPYPYPPNPYPGAVVAPPVMVLEPAPPLPAYQWSAIIDALFLERSSGGSIPLGYSYYNPGSGARLPCPRAVYIVTTRLFRSRPGFAWKSAGSSTTSPWRQPTGGCKSGRSATRFMAIPMATPYWPIRPICNCQRS